MKTMTFAISMLAFTFSAFAADDRVSSRDPLVILAEDTIRSAVAALDPNLTLSYGYSKYHPQDSLVVKYKTRDFMIHYRTSKYGGYSKKAEKKEGPSRQGFLLEIRLEKVGTGHQIEIPQTLRRPYWRTDVDIRIMDKSSKQFYCLLSYGFGTDQKLLTTVKKAVNSLGRRYIRGDRDR